MLLFKDTKEGQNVYMFNRKSAEYKVGSVSSAPSLPHYVQNSAVLMTDVIIKVEGSEKTYSIPENLSLTYAGDWCLATEQHDLLREVEALDAQAEKQIADVPRLEEVRERCKQLKLDLNPQLKAQEETEKRFSRLESNVSELTSMMKTFMKKNFKTE